MIKIDIRKQLRAADGQMNLRCQIDIEKGEFVTLYGDSGAGKTSTLRMLAGLMQPDKGEIIVNEKVWFDSENRTNLRPQKRRIGFVFQDYALFPNMTVRGNLEFALRKNQDKKIVTELIEIMELGELQNQKPDKLSGGQQQRAALARAVIGQPEILLLDEPLSALDFNIRLKLQDYLAQVHRKFDLTTILISHDPGEIIKLADKVFVMEKGVITRIGTPFEIFTGTSIENAFKITGQILKIEPSENGFEITVLIGADVLKIPASELQAHALKIGDKIVLATKDWRPDIFRVG